MGHNSIGRKLAASVALRVRLLLCSAVGTMPRATLLALVLVAPTHVTGVTYLSGAESGGLGTALFGGGSSSDDCTSGFLDAVFSAADPSLEADTLSVARCGLTAASLPEDDIVSHSGTTSHHSATSHRVTARSTDSTTRR